jgi:hypothetical protein
MVVTISNEHLMQPFCLRLVMAFLWFGVLPTGSQAQFTFITNKSAITITAYIGSDKAVSIPSTTNGLPVTGIGVRAFQVCTGMTSVTIPGSVTNFGWPSFQNCTNLLAVYFQGNAPRDAYPAAPPIFGGDPNATLYYLQGSLGWGSAFDQLPAVKWDPQVLTQLLYTTNGNAIKITGYTGPGGAVVVPGTINGLRTGSIGSNAWFNITSLTGITLPNTVTNLGNSAFAGCTALTSVAIPNSVAGSGVFSNCTSLTNLTFSPAATGIADSEFSGCTALTTVTLPADIAGIADWAFQNCSNLTAVYFQGNAPVADATVFAGADNVTNYYLPSKMGWGTMFAGRPAVPVLFTYTASSSAITITKYIGIWSSVAVPDVINGLPVTAIGNVTFGGTGLTNILIGSNVTSIAGQAFVGCANLLAINVEANNPVYSSRDGVLFNQSQTVLLYYPGGRAGNYTIPDGVTSLPNYAFQSCPNLTSLTVPGSVTSIATLAFNVDSSLVTLYFLGNAPDVAWDAFDIQNTVTVFYLPGTTGWDTNLGGLPTVLWNPQAQTSDGSFGVRTNRFGFNITGNDALVVRVEACTNLASPTWIPLATNTLTGGSAYFSDATWKNQPRRFYRLNLP